MSTADPSEGSGHRWCTLRDECERQFDVGLRREAGPTYGSGGRGGSQGYIKTMNGGKNKNSEKRVAITPDIVKKYISAGFQVILPENYGNHLGFSDNQYKTSGASIFNATNISTEVMDCVIMVLIVLYKMLIDTSSNKGPTARLISLPPTSIIIDVSEPPKSKLLSYV